MNSFKCPLCSRTVKNLQLHIDRYHPEGVDEAKGPENSSSAPVPIPAPKGRVKFFSPRSAELRVVVAPTRRGFVQTPQGSMDTVFMGKSAQFMNGEYETDDPEIIEHLTSKYNDRRYPVVNLTKVESKV